ncbi:hypothetical protein Q7O_003646 [Pectobacterium carotovorum subsp. carotovorum PCCS1]|nr:hypothetical protein [Pectobacterium carotovorum subsp. carotovorum PCCS1]
MKSCQPVSGDEQQCLKNTDIGVVSGKPPKFYQHESLPAYGFR